MKLSINYKKILYVIIFWGLAIYTYSQGGLVEYIFKSTGISYLFLITLTLICIFLGIKNNKLIFSINKNQLLLLAMLLVVLFNNNGNILSGNFVYEIQFLCIFFMYLCLNKLEDWQKYFVVAFFSVGMIFSIVTIITYLSPNFYFDNVYVLFPEDMKLGLLYTYNKGYMPGLTYHYSANGCYISFLVLLSAYIFYDKKNFVSGLVLIFNLIALFLTGKRAHIVFVILALFISYYRQNKKSNLRFLKVLLILSFSLIVFTVLCNFIPELSNFITRFIELSSSGDITLGRGTRIVEALKLFRENIFIGIGWDQFKYWHEVFFSEYINVHNIYVQLLCENGILFSVPFFLWMIIVFYKSYKLSQIDNPIFGLCFSYNIFFLLYGLTGNPIYDAPMFIPYLLICLIINMNYDNYFKIKFKF